jgi:DNA-binding transcriptional regulator GbsR (MarR family)
MLTMSAMGASLDVNVSTVSRALAKAQAWGLLVYTVGRGRFAGLAITRYVKGDPFHKFRREAAKARVRRWSETVQKRLSRLQVNLAPYLDEKGRGVDSLYYYLTSITSTKGARLKEEWRSDELVDIV